MASTDTRQRVRPDSGGRQSPPHDRPVSDPADLTERQEEMVQMVEDYVVAIQDRDPEAIMDMYGPMAAINIGGTEYSNADGTLEQFWSTAEWAGYQGFEPMLVGESTVVFGTEWVSRTGMTVIGFQPGSVGPVKIVSHEVT